MGFLAELESSEIGELSKLATGNYKLDPRMMLDVTVQRDRDIIFHDICLNDVCITKGAVARIVYLSVECDGIQALRLRGRRRHCVHPQRLYGLQSFGRRPHRGAGCPEYAHHPHLRTRYGQPVHRYVRSSG